MMRRVYGVLPWGIIALGVVHMAATFRFFDALSNAALWFFSGGLVMVLTGAVNLLNRSYGAIAPGLRWVCRGTNVALLGFSVVMAIVSRASILQIVFVFGLLGALTVFSWMPSPVRPAPGSMR